ncbi:Wzz/FepE/Etk N-terminal domain-containing protein, partial [bacterium]|nr:Wzz/FepE/Etk N-terminal domain-containing protein [bacterium]
MDSYFLDEDKSLDESQLDLKRYYRVLLKRWWIVVIVTAFIAGPWVYYLKLQPPVYEAEALIRFKSFAGNDPELAQSRKTQLQSRSFAERVVAQLGLSMFLRFETDQIIQRNQLFTDFSTTNKPVPGEYVLRLLDDGSFELIKKTELREAVISRGEIEDIRQNLYVTNGFSFRLVPDTLSLPFEIPFKIKTFRKAVKSFQSRIDVNVDRSGTLMSLSLSDTDPILVAEMTNRLAEIFIAESASLKSEGIKGRREIIQGQLNIVQQKLDQSDQALKDFKEKYSTYLSTDQSNQLSEVVSLTRLSEKLEETLNTLRDLLTKKDEEHLASNGSGPQAAERNIMIVIANHGVFNDDATMLTYRQSLRSLEEEWKTIASRLSPQNPKAKEILGKITQTHTKIEEIAKREIQEIEKELNTTKKDLTSAEYRLKQLPTQQYQLAELERNNKVFEKQYLELLSKFQDAQLTEAVSSEDIEILDPALVPEIPTNRDKKKKAMFGGVLGIMFGVGLVVTLEFLDKSI